MKPLIFLIFISSIFLIGCHRSKQSVSIPLIAKDSTKKLENANSLIAFVGKKIDLRPMPHVDGAFDNGFLAVYQIIQIVYDDYQNKTIEFRVYDHYGIPWFSKYENVLLYVSKANSFYYHEKYQFNEVYKTTNGRWAGPYSPDYSNQVDPEHQLIKPEIIHFAKDVYYPLKPEGLDYRITYREPFYKTEGDSAKVIYGNYVEDLFRLKKSGVLAYRGLFGDTIPAIPKVEFEEIK